jgi:nitrite reductase/ring-hydroxylating ferredoxin subunit
MDSLLRVSSAVIESAQSLCPVADLPDGKCRAFTVQVSGLQQEIFLVHKDGKIAGYLNSCPHTGGPLDWVPGQFLNLEGDLIQCATHDALFRIADGLCIAGPCSGAYLSPVPICVSDGVVWFDVAKGGVSS